MRVEPWFWLVAFFLGGGTRITDRESFLHTLLWMVVVFVSILVHELGHAMTSRKLTKVQPNIKLWGLGGLAYPNTHLNRQDDFRMTLAGPLAGLAFFGVVAVFCILQYGGLTGLDMIKWLIYPGFGLQFETMVELRDMHWVTFNLLRSLVFVNFWWSLINLLPVHPLDGGRIYATFQSSSYKVHQVGAATGVIVALIGWFVFGDWWIALMFGFLAYQNYQAMQQVSGGRR